MYTKKKKINKHILIIVNNLPLFTHFRPFRMETYQFKKKIIENDENLKNNNSIASERSHSTTAYSDPSSGAPSPREDVGSGGGVGTRSVGICGCRQASGPTVITSERGAVPGPRHGRDGALAAAGARRQPRAPRRPQGARPRRRCDT